MADGARKGWSEMRIPDGKVLIYKIECKPGVDQLEFEIHVDDKELVTCKNCIHARHDSTCGEKEYLCSLWLESEDQDYAVPADGFCHNGVARKSAEDCDDDCEHCDYVTCPKEEEDES